VGRGIGDQRLDPEGSTFSWDPKYDPGGSRAYPHIPQKVLALPPELCGLRQAVQLSDLAGVEDPLESGHLSEGQVQEGLRLPTYLGAGDPSDLGTWGSRSFVTLLYQAVHLLPPCQQGGAQGSICY
jgi:hypothetical protein